MQLSWANAALTARLEKDFSKRVLGSLAREDPVAVVTPGCHGVVLLRRRIHHLVERQRTRSEGMLA